MREKVMKLLADLGFSGAESAAYVALMKEPGATGYRVSRIIGKPVPNTYQALDSLHQKGAVLMDGSGRGRAYSALPIGEYLEGMKRNLDSKRKSIEEGLKEFAGESMAAGIYQLTTVEQVYERVRAMVNAAKSVLLADIFPEPLEELRPAFEAAAKRGVKVLLMVYTPTEVAGCEVIAPEKPAPHLEIWNGDWMNVVADCTEYVHSLLKKDGAGVHRAVWTHDDYLSIQAFAGAFHEFMFNHVVRMLMHDRCSEVEAELKRMNQLYIKDSPFYGVIRPWLKETVWKDADKPCPDEKPAGRRHKPAKE